MRRTRSQPDPDRTRQRAATPATVAREPRVDPLAELQARAGNEVVNHLVDGPTGVIAQPSMTVGAADDLYEREADRVAETVLRRLSDDHPGSETSVDPSSTDPQVQRVTRLSGGARYGGGELDADEEQAIRSAGGSGRPLENDVRAEMERGFGVDLGAVRIHADARADTLNRSLASDALTSGRDIFFRAGNYAPRVRSGAALLAHELAHTIQQGAVGEKSPTQRVQRKIGRGVPKDIFLALLEAVPQRRQLKNHIPSTGMGRFDAEYFHDRDELVITVRPYFEFCQTVAGGLATPGGWAKPDEDAFVDTFRQQAVAAWSGKYSFACIKPGFTELRADVVVDVVRELDPAKAHFHHRIQKNRGMITGIGREQNDDPTKINVGNFTEADAPVRPHDSKSTCAGIASHDVERLQDLAKAHHVNPIKFTKGSRAQIAPASRQNLDAFILAVLRTERPGSVPVPLVATGKSNKREASARGNPAQDRANAVKAYIDGKAIRNKPCETRLFDDVVSAQEAVYKSKKSKLSKEAEKEKLDPLKARQDHREVELDVKEDFVWNGDPYSILAHEFGHMLGNPDEYFAYGSAAVRDAKVRQLQASGTPEDLLLATKIAALTPTGVASHSSAQEGMVRLAEGAGQEIPEYGPKTSSIMSAGADVLPVHYTPLWEALSKITSDVITREEWSIV